MDENYLTRLKFHSSDWDKAQPASKNWWREWGNTSKKTAEKLAEQRPNSRTIRKINLHQKTRVPPSLPLHAEKTRKKKKSGKKSEGGNQETPGYSRFLCELSQCESVLELHPQICSCCGELRGRCFPPPPSEA